MPRTRQRFQPSTERLEVHVLLSSAGAAIASAATGSSLVETLSTDKTIYKVGQPVRITLTETNNSSGQIALPDMNDSDQFTATRGLSIIWRSLSQKQRAASMTLSPGETRTIKAIWNGRSNLGSSAGSATLTGTFSIDNSLANNTVTVAIEPRHGKGSKVGIVQPLPDMSLTLTP